MGKSKEHNMMCGPIQRHEQVDGSNFQHQTIVAIITITDCKNFAQKPINAARSVLNTVDEMCKVIDVVAHEHLPAHPHHEGRTEVT